MDYILFALDKIADMADGINQVCQDCLNNGQFYCESGSSWSGNNCIPQNWANDGYSDCYNDEDEKNLIKYIPFDISVGFLADVGPC